MADGQKMGPWAHHLRRINLENQFYESNTVLPISPSGADIARHRLAQVADAVRSKVVEKKEATETAHADEAAAFEVWKAEELPKAKK